MLWLSYPIMPWLKMVPLKRGTPELALSRELDIVLSHNSFKEFNVRHHSVLGCISASGISSKHKSRVRKRNSV